MLAERPKSALYCPFITACIWGECLSRSLRYQGVRYRSRLLSEPSKTRSGLLVKRNTEIGDLRILGLAERDLRLGALEVSDAQNYWTRKHSRRLGIARQSSK